MAQAWGPATRGVLLASPSNPTGTSIHPDEMRRISDVVRAKDGVAIVDEIYLGLSYDATFGHSALALGEHIVSVNSFSKYFNMTGWRLGWLVVPEALVAPIERLAQTCSSAPPASPSMRPWPALRPSPSPNTSGAGPSSLRGATWWCPRSTPWA